MERGVKPSPGGPLGALCPESRPFAAGREPSRQRRPEGPPVRGPASRTTGATTIPTTSRQPVYRCPVPRAAHLLLRRRNPHPRPPSHAYRVASALGDLLVPYPSASGQGHRRRVAFDAGAAAVTSEDCTTSRIRSDTQLSTNSFGRGSPARRRRCPQCEREGTPRVSGAVMQMGPNRHDR